MAKIAHIRGKPFEPGKTDLDAWSDEHSVANFGPSLTVQDHAKDTDINTIMARALQTGRMPDPNLVRMPTYDDYTDVVDYQTAMNAAIKASDAFMQYPAEFRARFQNDPQEFALWALNPNNRKAVYEAGLLNDAAKAAYEAGLKAEAEKAIADRIAADRASREPQRGPEGHRGGNSPPPPPGTPGTT